VLSAFADIKLPEPRISKFVLFLIKLLGRTYLFLFYGITQIVPHNEKTLFETFDRVMSGKSRCIIAFRHPNGGESQLLAWFFLFKLRKYAVKHGIRTIRRPHAIFVYGYEVMRWGGWVPRFVLPNMGATGVYHSKMDSKGMSRIYKAIVSGPYPVAIAPEGQVSYTADTVPRLEPGVIRIGFHAASELEKINPDCPVEILPLSIHFRFGPWGNGNMELLLRLTERLCGFSRKESKKLKFSERLEKCRDRIIEVNEERYKIKNDASIPLNECSYIDRIEKTAYAALETAERMLGLKSEGDYFVRLYKVRQICWDRIYIPDLYDIEKIPQIERSMMDLKAQEAWYIARHQEYADFSWYFKSPVPSDDAALHTKIEYIQNLHDFANRTMGGAFGNRVSIFPRKVIIKCAPVINLTERLAGYKQDRKNTIADTLSDLEKAYLENINEMIRDEQD